MIEAIMVIVLLGTLSLMAVGRMDSGPVDLITTTDKISSHLRLVQTLAMNKTPGIWGLRFDAGSQSYHMFYCDDPGSCDMTDTDNTYAVPGSNTSADPDGIQTRISDDGKVRIVADMNVAYDDFGIPHRVSGGQGVKITIPITLSLIDLSGNSHAIQIAPKTGFIQ